jgi:hypothetical protein
MLGVASTEELTGGETDIIWVVGIGVTDGIDGLASFDFVGFDALGVKDSVTSVLDVFVGMD